MKIVKNNNRHFILYVDRKELDLIWRGLMKHLYYLDHTCEAYDEHGNLIQAYPLYHEETAKVRRMANLILETLRLKTPPGTYELDNPRFG